MIVFQDQQRLQMHPEHRVGEIRQASEIQPWAPGKLSKYIHPWFSLYIP